MRLLILMPALALAQPTPTRTFFTLASSNGHGAVMADARQGKVLHWRERLAATEEPLVDAMGNDVFVGNQPQIIKSRDLLFDAYFGLRANGQQRWLTSAPDSSGYLTAAPAPRGGSGIVTWRHDAVLGLRANVHVFAPRGLPHSSMVMVLELENTGASPVTGVSAFSLHNLHLGFGRPGVMAELGATGETVTVAANKDVLERAFAGVVVARPIGGSSVRASAWNGGTPMNESGFNVVQSTTGDLVERTGDLGVGDDWASAYQLELGTLAPGAKAYAAVVLAHHGDPFGGATVQGWLDAWVAGRGAKAVLDDELAGWAAFQQALKLPTGLSSDEQVVARQSAVVLAMAQVKERETFVREHLSTDGEMRRTRLRGADGGTALPGLKQHQGAGAVLACLPPGEWTYAWIRDGAYATVAMSTLGLAAEAKESLRFYLDAVGGRFQSWNELKPYAMPPYQISLVRYTGFGFEETDFNDFGPNLEFDGFGLFLWALRQHELRTNDTSLTDARWEQVATKVADPLVALVDPLTGLIRKDSSIWETHWLGRERAWTYTSLTAARGLCDAAAIATRKGDGARAMKYRTAANSLRQRIAERLVSAGGVLASNLEELGSAGSFHDAAVLDAFAMGVLDPSGRIGRSTLGAFESSLRVSAGPGWSRNDDRNDHQGKTDLSPWGSEYDSAEWVVTDLRGAITLRAQGNATRADAILGWVTANGAANAGLIPETFDEASGAWKFNVPMVGFGAGAYVLALAHRGGQAIEPACDDYLPEPSGADAGVDGGVKPAGDGGLFLPDAGRTDGGNGPGKTGSCGCSGGVGVPIAVLGALVLRRRRKGV